MQPLCKQRTHGQGSGANVPAKLPVRPATKEYIFASTMANAPSALKAQFHQSSVVRSFPGIPSKERKPRCLRVTTYTWHLAILTILYSHTFHSRGKYVRNARHVLTQVCKEAIRALELYAKKLMNVVDAKNE